jgi:hypothetical protein
MARSRNIKPSLFKNELLGEADPIYTLLFAGLWTLADKEGRVEYRPKKIKAELFPYRFDLDPCLGLAWLMHESFITVYEISGKKYIQINKWKKHQNPHHKEVNSEIPPLEESLIVDNLDTNQAVIHACAKHDPSMIQEQANENASCPTDSLNLIPDSLNLIPSKTLVEKNPDDSEFDRFWEIYDKNVNRDKCRPKFRKLNKSDVAKIFETLPAYVDATPEKQFRKAPLVYLNNSCWNDEIINTSNGSGFNGQKAQSSFVEFPS